MRFGGGDTIRLTLGTLPSNRHQPKHDARVVGDIARLLSFSQRTELFVPTFDWLAQVNGELMRVHPHD